MRLKTIAIFITVALVFSLMPSIAFADEDFGGMTVSGGTSAGPFPDYIFEDGILKILSSTPLTLTGVGCDIWIHPGTTAFITMKDLGIDSTYAGCAFDMSDATVYLTLEGSNILESSFGNAGLRCPDGATLEISCAGSLTATGGAGAAGIGGNTDLSNLSETGGDIAITSGTVIANGGMYGAGIGGSYKGDGGTVTISGGTVNATGGYDNSILGSGAGIGGGSHGDGGITKIRGGIVKTTGGQCRFESGSGAGIGGGSNGGNGLAALSGGTVFATSGGSGAQDIGAGTSGSSMALGIWGTAAVFLKNNSCPTPTTSTHLPVSIGSHTPNAIVYGISVPWGNNFGAWLRKYTLAFNTNGGSGTVPASITQLTSTTTTVASPGSYTLEGYTQGSGWNTAEDGSETDYNAGDTFTFSADTILYAKWMPNTYTVQYDANGGTGATSSSLHTYDAVKNLTANGFTRGGYTFAGWASTQTGSVQYADKESVTNLTAANGATVTLYAVWTQSSGNTVPPSALGMPDSLTLYVGGRAQFTPTTDGGTWTVDPQFLDSHHSVYTVTALKPGNTVIRYTVGWEDTEIPVTILARSMPQTGQDFMPVYILIALAGCSGVAALVQLYRNRKAKAQ